MVQMYIKIQ